MKIGIDGRALQIVSGGIKRYVLELCKELDILFPLDTFIIYNKKYFELPIKSKRWLIRYDNNYINQVMSDIMWLKLRAGFFCDQDKLDIFWGAYTFLPRFRGKVKLLSTVYDLNYKIVPWTMPVKQFLVHKIFFKLDVKRAHTVSAISQGTSNRLFQFTGRRASIIVPPGVSEHFKKQDKIKVENCLKIHKVVKPYILSVCTWEPRKNIDLLIKTFNNMKENGLLLEYKLVLIGGKGWKDKKLIKLIDRTTSNDIIPLGYVSDEYLPSIYSGASVFVFPSIYEGFGIPVIEAKYCGTKVVATDIPELREAGGEDTIYVENTENSIKGGILRALKNDNIFEPNINNIYSWKKSAEILAKAIIDIV